MTPLTESQIGALLWAGVNPPPAGETRRTRCPCCKRHGLHLRIYVDDSGMRWRCKACGYRDKAVDT
jgi:C4-type Zn-finger protein